MNLEKYREIYGKESKRFITEWREFLSIQSISTDTQFKAECRRCTEWLIAHLSALGLKVECVETVGQPAVFGELVVDTAKPTLLFYGHYDVQPVDPVSLWKSPPFTPEEREGRLYARGAQDNKGQLFYFLKALETVIKGKELAYNIKVLIEGEEECGSGGITKALPALQSRLKSDVLLVCDTGTPDERLGCLTMGLRGILHLEYRIHGPSKDLHSGVHGGLVKNPASVLARLIASLHDDEGKVAIPGFYDDVSSIDPEDRKLANAFAFTDEWYVGQVGVLPTGGERGVAPMERRGLRPTIEVNGMYSGYLGEGSKTIIASSATVKISARLVAQQNPQKELARIIAYLEKSTPQEFRHEVLHSDAAGAALLVSSKSPVIQRARTVLMEITGTDPLFLWEGASIPFIPALIEASQAQPVLVGFGLEADNIHAPNESFALAQFEKGFLFCSRFLSGVL